MYEKNIKFYALIVLYNPEGDLYVDNVKKLILGDINVVVYDNSTSVDILAKNRSNILKISNSILVLDNNGENLGLSYAFNDAVKKLSDLQDYDGLFIFDQDSIVNSESIAVLQESYKKLIGDLSFGMLAGFPLRKDGHPYRVRGKNRSFQDDYNLQEVYQIPSSYSVIPKRTFNVIGNFENDFFIDQIDNNFSLRCVQNGLKIFIDKRAEFIHDIGLGNVFFLKTFLFPYSSPDRHYYQTRNLILSYTRYKVKRIKLFKKLFMRCLVIIYIGISKGDFFLRCKYGFLGIRDGINNIGGKFIKHEK
jgi:rhamnosyltransferase